MKIFLTVIFILGPSLYFGFINMPAVMGLSIVAGSIAGAFLNLDKFESFSGAGFKAEMKKAVDEAYATIDNLKKVAKPLLEITLKNLTYSNRLDGMDFDEKNNHVSELERLIEALTLEENELKKSVATFYRFHTWDLYSTFIDALFQQTNNPQLREKLTNLKDYFSINFPNEIQIINILAEFNVDKDNAKEDLEKYLNYLNQNEYKAG